MSKRYYVAVEDYDAKFFGDLKTAKNYMKNFIAPSRRKVIYEIMYDMV